VRRFLGFIFYVLHGRKLRYLENKISWRTFLYSSIEGENIYPHLWGKTKSNLNLCPVDVLTDCKTVTLTQTKLSLRKTTIHHACLSYKTILSLIRLDIWPTSESQRIKTKTTDVALERHFVSNLLLGRNVANAFLLSYWMCPADSFTVYRRLILIQKRKPWYDIRIQVADSIWVQGIIFLFGFFHTCEVKSREGR